MASVLHSWHTFECYRPYSLTFSSWMTRCLCSSASWGGSCSSHRTLGKLLLGCARAEVLPLKCRFHLVLARLLNLTSILSKTAIVSYIHSMVLKLIMITYHENDRLRVSCMYERVQHLTQNFLNVMLIDERPSLCLGFAEVFTFLHFYKLFLY